MRRFTHIAVGQRVTPQQRRRYVVVFRRRRRFRRHRFEPLAAAWFHNDAVGRRVMQILRRWNATLRCDAIRRNWLVDVDDDIAGCRRFGYSVVNWVGTVWGDHGLNRFVQKQNVVLKWSCKNQN